jgi:molybdopterin/thiamine biosynthesis adenylyltransferase
MYDFNYKIMITDCGGLLMERYMKNIGTFSPDEQMILKRSRVCVVGCGGLGGYIIELLGRLGIGHITAIDYDSFNETNLNRQLLSNEQNLGMTKAEQAAVRMKMVNSDIQLIPISVKLMPENAEELLSGHDLVIDALDNINSRLDLEKACEDCCIPLIHGAVSGLCGQVAVIQPGDRILNKIYRESNGQIKQKKTADSIPSFTPALVAALETKEAVKIILKKDGLPSNSLLMIDLNQNSFEIIKLPED